MSGRREAPRRLALGLAALGASLLVIGCAGTPSASLSHTPGPDATSSLLPADQATPEPSDAALSPAASGVASPAPSLASPVEGVVTHIDRASLTRVTSFTMLVGGGQQVVFTMGVQENAVEFPAAHLSEHLASSEPVRVFFHVEGVNLVVYRLEDASAGSPSAS